jgi:predicted lipoprotein with Yx(FWY)xxD motif
MKTRTTGLIVAVLGAAALLAAGCGSSSKSSSSTSAASAYPTANEQTTNSAAATTPASGTGVTVTVKHASKLGTILAAGSKKLTVYMFEGDKGASSSCSGACASVWPPVTSTGAAAAVGANKADLGTITRSDGTTQVTYKGHPLYFFAKDKDSGDAYGQGVKGFGADWYVLSPSGSKVDKS